MPSLTLRERMLQVEMWLGVVATRPLREADYKRAHTRPASYKRAYDGGTYFATYMTRHAQRNLTSGHTAKGVSQAISVPVLGLAMALTAPISICFIQRLEQSRVRSEEATREDTIAFELRNARRVAKTLARDDQVQMLKNVYGMTRKDVVAWACRCISLGAKVLDDIDQSSDRIKHSRLIRCQMKKMATSIVAVRDQYR